MTDLCRKIAESKRDITQLAMQKTHGAFAHHLTHASIHTHPYTPIIHSNPRLAVHEQVPFVRGCLNAWVVYFALTARTLAPRKFSSASAVFWGRLSRSTKRPSATA